MSRQEVALISAVVQTRDSIQAIGVGVDDSWFETWGGPWNWITRQARATGQIPEKAIFMARWPDFPLKVIHDVHSAALGLQEHVLRRTLIKTIHTTSNALQAQDDTTQLIENLHSSLKQMESITTGSVSESDALDQSSVIGEVTRRQARMSASGLSGVPYGWPTLDGATSGAQPGELMIVAARLGVGKSWSLLRWAFEALKDANTVQFDSLEQPRAQVAMRLHGFMGADLNSPIRVKSLSSGQVSVIDYQNFLDKAEATYLAPFIIDDTARGKVTINSIAAQIERNSPDVVYIDYITLMKMSQGFNSDWRAVAELSSELKGLAQTYQIPIIAAAQLNRNAINSETPGASDIAQADSIGQDADGVIVLVKESKHCVRAKLVKYRHGEDQQQWWLEFRINRGIYKEISYAQAQQIILNDNTATATP